MSNVPTRFLLCFCSVPFRSSMTASKIIGTSFVFLEASAITVFTKRIEWSQVPISLKKKKKQFSTIFSNRKSTKENRFPCWVSVLTPFGEKQLWFIKFCTKLSYILRQDHSLHLWAIFSQKSIKSGLTDEKISALFQLGTARDQGRRNSGGTWLQSRDKQLSCGIGKQRQAAAVWHR